MLSNLVHWSSSGLAKGANQYNLLSLTTKLDMQASHLTHGRKTQFAWLRFNPWEENALSTS
ncbi:hypothetical protein TSUD_162950 [Trifolium subterraneum]|uniref:Uncharacterized protein n=1 Tax=Trifolium subterraneum TaxID=3900 RepID=A0A2Z6MNQ0_TRISU|nr:hypothetical protein TSUD_162950 [Trifolium subterraneum]